MKTILVLAGSLQEAYSWARRHQLKPTDWRYAHAWGTVDSLRGYRLTAIELPGFDRRPDAGAITVALAGHERRQGGTLTPTQVPTACAKGTCDCRSGRG